MKRLIRHFCVLIVYSSCVLTINAQSLKNIQLDLSKGLIVNSISPDVKIDKPYVLLSYKI